MEQFEVTVNYVASAKDEPKCVVATLTVFKEAPVELRDKTNSVIVRKVQAFGTGKTIEEAEENAVKRAKKRLKLLGGK